jgi:hypothetical protein
MGQILHGSATTTHTIRAAIERLKTRLKELAAQYGLNHKTVAKWRKRAFVNDAPNGAEGSALDLPVVRGRGYRGRLPQANLLPLDDCLYALQATIPNLTRSSLHRCLSITALAGCRRSPATRPPRPFKRYPIGYFHINIVEVRQAQPLRSDRSHIEVCGR